MLKSLGSVMRFLALTTASTLLLLILLEGIASTLFFFRRVSAAEPLAERRHTRHDPLLGWCSIPGIKVEDLYAPGKHLTLNQMGFRNLQEFTKDVPEGRYRIICAGDSFTQGYGVGDEETWCHRLTEFDPRIEAVNMGQCGYGCDQAYLWYMRDGVMLDHHAHVFAFIVHDLYRMSDKTFDGIDKPFMVLQNGKLVVINSPIPDVALKYQVVAFVRQYLEEFRLYRLVNRIVTDMGLRKSGDAAPAEENKRIESVFIEMMRELDRVNREKGSRLVAVMLPTEESREEYGKGQWAEVLARRLHEIGIEFVDLDSRAKTLSQAAHEALFLKKADLHERYAHGAGHLSVEGNRFVAEQIYESAIAGRIK